MKSWCIRYIIVIVCVVKCTGCSFYFNQPVTFHIRDAETGEPIKGAEVKSYYSVMMDFGALFSNWGIKEGITDANGKITLVIDPYHHRLGIDITAKGYQLDNNLWGDAIQSRLSPTGRSFFGNDFVLEMYKDPESSFEVIIPQGYRGPVLINFDPARKPPIRAGQRHFTYEANEKGQIIISESGLLERVCGWDRMKASYKDGQKIKIMSNPIDTPESDSVALWFITPVWKQHTWVYILGTKAEAKFIMQALWGDGNHFDESFFLRLKHGQEWPIQTDK